MQLIKACKELIIREPFYGLFLLNLNKEISDTYVDTACVSRNGVNSKLVINPNYWDKLTDNQQLGLLKHELIHICFNHMFIESELRISDHKLFNIACDLVCDQYIKDVPDNMWDQLKDKYPDLVKNLEKDKGAKYYYEELIKYAQKNSQSGQKGSGSGNRGTIQGLDGISGGADDHKSWKEYQNLDEAGKKLMQNQTEHQLKEAATATTKSRGSIPREFQSIIDALFKVDPPIFNWKMYFRRLLGNSFKTYTKKSLRKESNRFVGSTGIKVKHKQHILVGIDTSGSVSDSELQDFFSEIYHIYKTGSMVTIVECDADIHKIYEYKGKFDGKITGRGGTDFKPVIDYYNANLNKYTTLVFFTDGYAPLDTFKPMRQMMWVITSNGHKTQKYPGHTIFIP